MEQDPSDANLEAAVSHRIALRRPPLRRSFHWPHVRAAVLAAALTLAALLGVEVLTNDALAEVLLLVPRC